jgi:AMMECR1 domain-containing protein
MAVRELAIFAFQYLISYLETGTLLQYPPRLPNQEYPLFVTWHKHEQLRGCMGTFVPQPLSINLPYFTNISSNDPRFPPITVDELPLLTCTVSLLVNFEIAKKWDDWEIGTNGVELLLSINGTFADKEGNTIQHFFQK